MKCSLGEIQEELDRHEAGLHEVAGVFEHRPMVQGLERDVEATLDHYLESVWGLSDEIRPRARAVVIPFLRKVEVEFLSPLSSHVTGTVTL